jgi:hypothetical protein
MEKELEHLLEELTISKSIVDTSRGPVWYVLPTAEDRLFSKFIYDKSLKKYLEEGAPSIEDTTREHEELGLWTKAHDTQLEKLPQFIEETIGHIDNEVNRVRKKKYQHWLKQLQQRQLELNSAKIEMISNSAETLANEAANAYIIWKCYTKINGEHIWDTYENMLRSEDGSYIRELTTLLYDVSAPLNTQDVRELARESVWRLKWNVSKNDIRTLFKRDIADLSPNQTMLVYWSQVYDSVYESLDRPPQSVINDDVELDKWFKEQNEKNEREISQKYYGKGSSPKGNAKIDNSPEVFKVVAGYFDDDGQYILYPDEERWEQIEKIRKLNAPETRAVQRKGEDELRQSPGQFKEEQRIRKTERAIEATGGTLQIRKR